MYRLTKIIILFYCIFYSLSENEISEPSSKSKTVLVAILARNKQHTLPYVLTLFSQLNYPKSRISLFIRSDHNIDDTNLVIKEWLKSNQHFYHSVDTVFQEDIKGSFSANWTEKRFNRIISLRDEALMKARKIWADYIWFVDADAFIFEPDALTNLINQKKAIVAPMLKSLGRYSNYWCGMTDHYWYVRTEEYIPILERKKKGCFNVPMVHSCVLIDLSLTASDFLSHDSNELINYNGPRDDIIAFAISAKSNGLDMFVCNDIEYGFIPPPLESSDNLSKDHQYIVEIKLQAFIHFPPVSLPSYLSKFARALPPKSKLGFDNIYLINLKRRKDRLDKMQNSLSELGIESQVFEAFDGKKFNVSYLDDLGIKQLHNYKDPWSKRDMTYGEIGCFLSHYFIWEDIVKHQYDKVIIFEDDIRFESYFKDKLFYLIRHMNELSLKWDLVYLGRKILEINEELFVIGSEDVVEVSYSHWTLCYMITLEGAKKLLRPKPLGKMVPVDEYLPIMYNRHPKSEWMAEFEPRNLMAYAVHPLLVFPTHYTGDEGYISDTEHSTVIEPSATLSFEEPCPPDSHLNSPTSNGAGLACSGRDEL